MPDVREILVISGKGGTGKTSLTAAFAVLAKNAVLADCDVDAADLHLLLAPTVRHEEPFVSGHSATIRRDQCTGCGRCAELCRFDAIRRDASDNDQAPCYTVDPLGCEGCGVCVRACPHHAIDFPEAECGTWSVSDTRAGTMAHAALHPGGENSGKLVSRVRQEAKRLAHDEEQRDLILIDGPPGVGCPVIAAMGGVSLAVVVTEPTLSGEHDLSRVLDLAKHFSVPAAVCVNKWDINPAQTERIESLAQRRGARLAGRVRYASAFTAALRQGRTVLEWNDDDLADEVRSAWTTIEGTTP